MSIFSGIKKVFKSKVFQGIVGVVNPAAGAILSQVAGGPDKVKTQRASVAPTVMPGGGVRVQQAGVIDSAIRTLPAIARGVGAVVAGGARAVARQAVPTAVAIGVGEATRRIFDSSGNVVGYVRRRRARGFTARDISQAKRIIRMLKDVERVARAPHRKR